jgi:energy-coupling factor transporter ATP-binding protein EcfA2
MNGNEVQSVEIDWLWESFIPNGLLTLITGESGSGKSTLLCALAAGLSSGKSIDGKSNVAPGNVLLFCPEEEPSFILKPRLVAHGAALERCLFGDYSPDRSMLSRLVLPADVRRLSLMVKLHRARLVILDPITAYIGGGLDMKDDIGVRRLLEELQLLAMDTGAAFVFTRHFRKSREGSILDRVGGNAAWTQFPRTVLTCGTHPDNPAERVLVSAKPSLTGAVSSVAFRIEKVGLVGRLTLTGACSVTSEDLSLQPADAAERDALTDACAFLNDFLHEGEQTAKECGRIAEESGISRGTLRRAKVKLGICSIPRGPNAQRYHAWSLPESSGPDEGPNGA